MSVRSPLLGCLLTLTLAASFGAAAHARTAAAAPRTIEITVTDQMKYDVPTIAAKRGETLTIRLRAAGSMPKNIMAHNFVVLKKAADVSAFVAKANVARETNYIPADLKTQVLAATGLIGNGEAADVTFKAPTVPGSYAYLCTFPGHYAAGMKGTLVVK